MSGSVTCCPECRANTWAGRPCANCGKYAVGLRDILEQFGLLPKKKVGDK